jgi:predicted DsbA family dithiol-disulfide isomerase
MSSRIKIDLVSDVVCPWCIIGYRRLQQAIDATGAGDSIDLEWHPFELNPGMPAEGEDLRAHIARKYGSSPEEYERTRAGIVQLAAEAGFRIDFFDGMKIVNTMDAHILLDHARQTGRQTELQLRLFDAYFNERKDISDRAVLRAEIERLGMDGEAEISRLDSGDARERVQAAMRHWRSLGVSAVPTMVFDDKGALTGAQPVDIYRQVLNRLLAEKTPETLGATT